MKKSRFDIGVSEETANLACLISVIGFLCCHVTYFIVFFITKINFMMYFNVFSIIFYISSFFFVKRHGNLYVRLTYIEVVAHAIAGTICSGWDFGFQYIFLGMPMLIYFTVYMMKKLGHKDTNPFILSMVCVLAFISLSIWNYFREPLYFMDKRFIVVFDLAHGLIVFLFVIVFMYILTGYALSLEERIYNKSITDNLTNIYNREGIKERFGSIEKNEYENYILAIGDIDNFKKLNDTYGHSSGDIVLQRIGELFKYELQDDIVCRWGGEEFVVLIKITSSKDDVYKKLNELRMSISELKFNFKKKNVGITITIGAIDYRGYDSLDEWVSEADKKLYYGKANGKNIVVH